MESKSIVKEGRNNFSYENCWSLYEGFSKILRDFSEDSERDLMILSTGFVSVDPISVRAKSSGLKYISSGFNGRDFYTASYMKYGENNLAVTLNVSSNDKKRISELEKKFMDEICNVVFRD